MREIKFCVIKKEVSPTIPETPLFDLLFPKEGKLSHAKVGAAVGQKAFDFHRPDGGAGSGKGGGAAVAAFPCYRHTGHQKGNGSAFWREREVLNGLFLHFYFRTGEAVRPGRSGINFIIAVGKFTAGNVCVYLFPLLANLQSIDKRSAAECRQAVGTAFPFGRGGEGKMQHGFLFPYTVDGVRRFSSLYYRVSAFKDWYARLGALSCRRFSAPDLLTDYVRFPYSSKREYARKTIRRETFQDVSRRIAALFIVRYEKLSPSHSL